MLDRCQNPKNHAYKDYGGRGIGVSEKWLSFEGFLADMGQPPSELHTLDRINNDKGYCLENCRWATKKEQSRNRKNNRLLRYKGQTKTVAEWAEIAGLTKECLGKRLKRGWGTDEAISTPPTCLGGINGRRERAAT